MPRLRAAVKTVIPQPWRRRAARIGREFPAWIADLFPDLVDGLGGRADPLPPTVLRRRVAGTSSRRAFLRTGTVAFESISKAFSRTNGAGSDRFPRWLDFGCGCGRVARHLARFSAIRELWGVDVDRQALDWCAAHLRGRFLPISREPPLPFEASRFDVAYAGSVFTHFDSRRERVWLSELHRVLRAGGLLIVTTHSPELIFGRPDLTEQQHQELAREGVLFAPGGDGFNEDSAFHSREYLIREWGRLFGLELYLDHGLDGFQDLYVWRKW